MAQASHISPRITAATRRRAYLALGELLDHIPGLGVDLVSIVRNADNTVTITFTGPIDDAQADHLNITRIP